MRAPLRLRHLVLLLSSLLSYSVQAQQLGNESFQTTNSSNFTLGGSATLTAANGTDPNGSGYLRLTTNDQAQAGFAISNQTFPASQGFNISFELFSYGGSGGDGMSMFLVDGNQTDPASFRPGASGGSLGYAQKSVYPAGPGVPYGYFGVGFDEFGNFSQATEGRVGGPGYTPNAVAIRGAGNGSGTSDYPYLSGTGTLSFPLNVSTTRAQVGTDDYRKAFVAVVPVANGYEVTVRLQHGNSLETVVNRYAIANPPSRLRIGFAGSTGASTDFHELRKLTIAQSPYLADQNFRTAPGQPISINALQGAAFTYAAYAPGSVDLDMGTPGVQNSLNWAAGSFTVSSAGVVQYTPAAGYTGTVTVPITATDQVNQTSVPANISFAVAAPLPVTLAYFSVEASRTGQDAILRWVSALELNAAAYVVERSFDGSHFSPIFTVAAHGTTTGATAYAYLDADVAARFAGQTLYYRLRQQDYSGVSTYSSVRILRLDGSLPLAVYPNPVAVGDSWELSGLSTQAYSEVQVLTPIGQLVRRLEVCANNPRCQLTGLTPGLYILNVLTPGQLPRTLRLQLH